MSSEKTTHLVFTQYAFTSNLLCVKIRRQIERIIYWIFNQVEQNENWIECLQINQYTLNVQQHKNYLELRHSHMTWYPKTK